jgi:predicted Zn-dependent protease
MTLSDGTLVVSDRLLITLRSEAQLAFVLAHELGHLALKHHQTLGERKLSTSQRHAMEEEADSFALGVIAAAGYDPRAGLSALAVFSQGLAAPGEETPTHPGGRRRLERGLTLIADAGWTPPGIVNRRDFLVVQSRLMDMVRQRRG